MEHHFGHAAGEISSHRRVIKRAVGQNADQPGDLDVDLVPVVDGGPRQSGGEGDGRDVEQQVGRSAERGVDDHGIANGGIGEDIGERQAARGERDERPRRSAGHVAPDRLAGRGERGVRKRDAECLGDNLRRGGGAQKLAAAAGTGAGPAAQFGGLGQRELAMSEAGADRLDLAGVFALARGQA